MRAARQYRDSWSNPSGSSAGKTQPTPREKKKSFFIYTNNIIKGVQYFLYESCSSNLISSTPMGVVIEKSCCVNHSSPLQSVSVLRLAFPGATPQFTPPYPGSNCGDNIMSLQLLPASAELWAAYISRESDVGGKKACRGVNLSK